MHAVIFSNQVSSYDSAAELDVLGQCVEVESSLRRLGFTTERIFCTLNLDEARIRLQQARPDVVFNLVEALGGKDRLTSLAILLMESMHLKFTGACSLDNMLAAVKTTMKQRLVELRLPTATWISPERPDWQGIHAAQAAPSKVIIKADAEHASFAVNDNSVTTITPGPQGLNQVLQRLRQKSLQYKTPFFAEEFIDGREFHVGVLSQPGKPLVLPPFEIQFIDFPDSKPRIFGAEAKWDFNSIAYGSTGRTFDFPASDQPLLDKLQALARRCWMECGFHGYARIDFRVDEGGEPWILEVNLNPRLSPEGSFAAALAETGISFDEAVQRIVADAMR